MFCYFCSLSYFDSTYNASASRMTWTLYIYITHIIPGWWFGTCFIFHFIYGIILPMDFHIFQDGYCTTSQILHESLCLSMRSAKLPKFWGYFLEAVCGVVPTVDVQFDGDWAELVESMGIPGSNRLEVRNCTIFLAIWIAGIFPHIGLIYGIGTSNQLDPRMAIDWRWLYYSWWGLPSGKLT